MQSKTITPPPGKSSGISAAIKASATLTRVSWAILALAAALALWGSV